MTRERKEVSSEWTADERAEIERIASELVAKMTRATSAIARAIRPSWADAADRAGKIVACVEKSAKISRVLADIRAAIGKVPLTPLEVVFLVIKAQGADLQAVLSAWNSENAKKPRRRARAANGGRALVAVVKEGSNKKKWNTAWKWLCDRADSAANEVEGFTVSKSGDDVIEYKKNGHKASIRQATFRKYW